MYTQAEFYLKWVDICTPVKEIVNVFVSPLDTEYNAVKTRFEGWLVSQQCGMMEEIEESNFEII